jgi:BlaI family transcriptional regulator, penicillinase repressor
MAQRKTAGPLTPLELEIMKVLWDAGPSSVQDVQRALEKKRPLAYTTVQTMLNLLHRKGKAERQLEDRAYRYAAAVSRKRETGKAMRDLIDRFFGGSAEGLVMSLVETRHLSRSKLAELQERLESAEDDDGRD